LTSVTDDIYSNRQMAVADCIDLNKNSPPGVKYGVREVEGGWQVEAHRFAAKGEAERAELRRGIG
jgi:hypothetical protein